MDLILKKEAENFIVNEEEVTIKSDFSRMGFGEFASEGEDENGVYLVKCLSEEESTKHPTDEKLGAYTCHYLMQVHFHLNLQFNPWGYYFSFRYLIYLNLHM